MLFCAIKTVLEPEGFPVFNSGLHVKKEAFFVRRFGFRARFLMWFRRVDPKRCNWKTFFEDFSEWQDLNLRLHVPKTCTLPTASHSETLASNLLFQGCGFQSSERVFQFFNGSNIFVFYRVWTCYPKLRRLVLYPIELRILSLFISWILSNYWLQNKSIMCMFISLRKSILLINQINLLDWYEIFLGDISCSLRGFLFLACFYFAKCAKVIFCAIISF